MAVVQDVFVHVMVSYFVFSRQCVGVGQFCIVYDIHMLGARPVTTFPCLACDVSPASWAASVARWYE